ncbi:MAG: hypothetical protein ACKOWL_01260 [Sphingobacteriaceae bacterium]
MKKEIGYLGVVLLFAACSSSKIAATDDNVYSSKARAKEFEPYVRSVEERPGNRTESPYSYEELGDYDYRYDDMSYSSRLDRFHTYSPWRNYYDSWYDYRYDPYYNYDPYSFRNNSYWSWNMYIGPRYGWSYGYYPWDYNPYRYRWGNYWGTYSYYNPMPYYPGYYNGNYPTISYPYNPRTYRPKPARGEDSMNPNFGIGGNGAISGSRADRYNGGSSSVPPRTGGSVSSPRADRSRGDVTPADQNRTRPSTPPADSGQSRPARTERSSPPPPPPSNNNSSSGSRSDNTARPARARDGQ